MHRLLNISNIDWPYFSNADGHTYCIPCSQVMCQGQIIGAILAEDQVHAQRAAKRVKVEYEELEPIITIKVRGLTRL